MKKVIMICFGIILGIFLFVLIADTDNVDSLINAQDDMYTRQYEKLDKLY